MYESNEIRELLLSLGDEKYRSFASGLIPNISPELIIGIRTPVLRKLAKKLAGSEASRAFLDELPHLYQEENSLHSFLLEGIDDPELLWHELLRFLPYVDNWAVCDSMNPKLFKSYPEGLLDFATSLTEAKDTYTVRYGILILMRYFLEEHFDEAVLQRVAELRSDEYYIKMAAAWFFQAAFVKQRDKTLPYFTGHRLDTWVHNKAIQKCIESRVVSEEEKELLRGLKIK